MARKKETNFHEEVKAIDEQSHIAGLKQSQTRARSLTIGTTTGGIIEVAMRGDFSNLWYLLHPVEAVEIINQLAAAAGLEVATRPRNDFASWRSWDTQLPDSVHWMGTAPWQLSPEQREELGAVKVKNLKPVEEKEAPKLESSADAE